MRACLCIVLLSALCVPAAERTVADALADVSRRAAVPVAAAPELAARPAPPVPPNVPFWKALDALAAGAGARVALADAGRSVRLVPAAGPTFADSDGPFRVAVSAVQSRVDFAAGATVTEMTLDVLAEPRFPVFRADARPDARGRTDTGTPVSVPAAAIRTPFTGWGVSTTFPLSGVTREAKRIDVLEGVLRVTAADGWLNTGWDIDGGREPFRPPGVTMTLRKAERRGDTLAVEVDAERPGDTAAFESFEVAALAPELTLTKGDASLRPGDVDVTELPNRLRVRARFELPHGAGWRLEARVPGPVREVLVRFRLTGVPLP